MSTTAKTKAISRLAVCSAAIRTPGAIFERGGNGYLRAEAKANKTRIVLRGINSTMCRKF